MNAVLALSHFCELHGPSILFCTQTFQCKNHTPEQIASGVPTLPSQCGITMFMNLAKENEGNEASTNKQSNNKASTCNACRSLQPGEPGFICIDKESHISYISVQYPEDRELYSILRHACVRSLSCEVCPGREGPIMFGDEASGYVFSYTFFLKDTQSRGFQRWYSLICVMMDRFSLANSWMFLVENFKEIIVEIQSKAEKVYKAELAERDSQPSKSYMAPDQFRRARGGLTYRSLVDITKDQDIFVDLHESFTFILKAAALQFVEIRKSPFEKYLVDEEQLQSAASKIKDLSLENYQDVGDGPIFTSLKHLYQVFGLNDTFKLAYHIVRGDQLIVQGDFQRTVVSALRVLKDLVPHGCYNGKINATSYEHAFKYNFLGLQKSAVIPNHIMESSLYVLMRISSTLHEDEEIEQKSHFSSCENSFGNVEITVTGSSVDAVPTYLRKLIDGLKSDCLDAISFQAYLNYLKEKWFAKVKTLFCYLKSAVRSREEKLKLLKVLQAKPEDEILLKYWMTAMSLSFKNRLLALQEGRWYVSDSDDSSSESEVDVDNVVNEYPANDDNSNGIGMGGTTDTPTKELRCNSNTGGDVSVRENDGTSDTSSIPVDN